MWKHRRWKHWLLLTGCRCVSSEPGPLLRQLHRDGVLISKLVDDNLSLWLRGLCLHLLLHGHHHVHHVLLAVASDLHHLLHLHLRLLEGCQLHYLLPTIWSDLNDLLSRLLEHLAELLLLWRILTDLLLLLLLLCKRVGLIRCRGAGRDNSRCCTFCGLFCEWV